MRRTSGWVLLLFFAAACGPGETTPVTIAGIELRPRSTIFGMKRHRVEGFVGSSVYTRTFVVLSSRPDECARVDTSTRYVCEGRFMSTLEDPGDGTLLAFTYDLPDTVPFFEEDRKTLEWGGGDTLAVDFVSQRPGEEAVRTPSNLNGLTLTGHGVSDSHATGTYKLTFEDGAAEGYFSAQRCDALFEALAACPDLEDP